MIVLFHALMKEASNIMNATNEGLQHELDSLHGLLTIVATSLCNHHSVIKIKVRFKNPCCKINVKEEYLTKELVKFNERKISPQNIRTSYKGDTRMDHIQHKRLPKSKMAPSEDRITFEFIVHVLRFGNRLNKELCCRFIFINLQQSLDL